MVVVVKKVKNFVIKEKNRPKYFFFNERGYIDQKLAEESKKVKKRRAGCATNTIFVVNW